MSELLTTREVAALLRLKERKIYELARTNAIPVSRVTGKLLFPRVLVEAWVARGTEYRGGTEALAQRPAVLAGSHDPLLDWALREAETGLATFFDGSLDGLERLGAGQAIAAGLHLWEPESDEWNRAHVARAVPGQPVVLVEWARRTQGLVLAPDNPKGVRALADLAGLTFIPRQGAAGSRWLLEQLLARAGIGIDALARLEPPARSETDVAVAVAEGRADAGFAIEAVARQLRLAFVPVIEERYDLAVWRRAYFEPPLQRLLAFARTPALAARARAYGGYDLSGLGRIHYNGP